MTETGVLVQLDGDRNVFLPGESLSGRYRIVGLDPAALLMVRLSVHWFTDGKGNQDLGVHWSEERPADAAAPATEGTFAVPLPCSPLSYDGVLMKIVWCVQVKATPRSGKALVGETYFHLGEVTPGVEVAK